jgi:ATP-dependent DNA helicase RecQ
VRRAAPAPAQEEAAAPVVPIEEVRVTAQELGQLGNAAKKLFGFDHLLPAQAEVMALARRGEHVLAVLPTGAGKSLCYQLPAFMDGGLTLVVSPLIALMKDQVDGLPDDVRKRAIAIHSLQEGAAQRDAFDGIARGRYQLVYVAPERLRQLPFIHLVRSVGLRRLVIDEAHCVSVWGHDFRPDYLHIRRAHADLGAPPVLGLTATAPPRVRSDIQRQLFGVGADNRPAGDLRVIAADTYRPNLTFSAVKVADNDEKMARALALCKQLDGPGIVYARSRANTEQIAELLRAQGVKAEAYHAGLADRHPVQDRFMAGQTRVIVATIAFGMGIDKPDIRFIIHFGLSNSVEAYYQEAGRAGRDGKPSHCVLLYTASDKNTLARFASQDNIDRDFLRAVYAAAKAGLYGQTTGPVSLASLQLAVGENDDTKVRVALSMLEEAGLLQRHYDAPVSANLMLAQAARDPELRAFAQAARLAPGQWVDWNFAELARATGLDTATLEWKLLGWRGPLTVNTAGRDLMLTLKPGGKDAGQRVDALIERNATIQKQRVTEIYAYAQTRRCRNGHLAAYLGGHPRTRCTNCDNCGIRTIHDLPFTLPDESELEPAILGALGERSWGRLSLVRLLRGDAQMQPRGGSSPYFGRLRDRSETVVKNRVEALIDAGCIEEVPLDNGGIALRLTAAGRKRLPQGAQRNKP